MTTYSHDNKAKGNYIDIMEVFIVAQRSKMALACTVKLIACVKLFRLMHLWGELDATMNFKTTFQKPLKHFLLYHEQFGYHLISNALVVFYFSHLRLPTHWYVFAQVYFYLQSSSNIYVICRAYSRNRKLQVIYARARKTTPVKRSRGLNSLGLNEKYSKNII